MSRQYPRQAWVLTHSLTPKEITVVKPYRSYEDEEEWDVIDTGKMYHRDRLFPSKVKAIANGRAQVEKQKANIARLQTMLNKRISALNKAERSTATETQAAMSQAPTTQQAGSAVPMCEGCDDPAKVYPDGSTGLCDACERFAVDVLSASDDYEAPTAAQAATDTAKG